MNEATMENNGSCLDSDWKKTLQPFNPKVKRFLLILMHAQIVDRFKKKKDQI